MVPGTTLKGPYMEKTEGVKQALERVLREMVEKEGLSLPSYGIEATLAAKGGVDYLIEYIGKDGKPAGLGFRNIRAVEPKDFEDPKFKVRLVHNLALWLKAQEQMQEKH